MKTSKSFTQSTHSGADVNRNRRETLRHATGSWAPRWRRWRRRLLRFVPRRGGAPVQFVYSRRYAVDLDSPVIDRERGQRVLTFLDREGLLRRGDLHRTRRVSMRKLLRVHDADYLASLETPEGLSRVLGHSIEPSRVEEVLLAERAMVGGTVLAARLALRDGSRVFNLGGGLHHALPDRGQGFCLFHDIAVAIVHLRRRGFAGRILVVDLDLHDGEGTRRIFADDPTVHTYSVHNRHLDDVGAIASTSLELGTGVTDDRYRHAIESTLPEVVERFDPEFVFYLAGVDPAFDDRIGDWQIGADTLLWRDRFVVELVRPEGSRRPLVILMAGGYGHQAWRHTARFATWLAGGKVVEPPDTGDLPLTTYRRLARHLSEPMFLGEATGDENEWGLTAEDLPGPTGAPAPRILGRYTVHGVELALERLGLLGKLRALGYEHVVLEADLGMPMGDTLRLVAPTPERPVLMELRGRIDANTVPGLTVLFVEWMLSQNPRSGFPRNRPELTGQKHPGTGLLRDIASLLLLAAERIELDGLAYVPSHVALALQSAGLAGFVDAERGRRFAAAHRAVRGRPFLERVRLLEGGKVVDAATGEPYRWEPTLLLVPVSDSARARVEIAWTERCDDDPRYVVED